MSLRRYRHITVETWACRRERYADKTLPYGKEGAWVWSLGIQRVRKVVDQKTQNPLNSKYFLKFLIYLLCLQTLLGGYVAFIWSYMHKFSLELRRFML